MNNSELSGLRLFFFQQKNCSKFLFTLIILIVFNTYSIAQFSNIEFVENKGQWNELVKYKGQITNGAFFLEANGFRVMQHNAKDMEEIATIFHGPHDNNRDQVKSSINPDIKPFNPDSFIIHSHAYDVRFLNALQPIIIPDKALPTYNNYIIGNNPEKWKNNCRIFQAVKYSEMYKGIDVRYYTDNGRLKYDIIVLPGADASQVVMKYDGVDELKTING